MGFFIVIAVESRQFLRRPIAPPPRTRFLLMVPTSRLLLKQTISVQALFFLLFPAIVWAETSTIVHPKPNLTPSELAAARRLDWVPVDELTELQKKAVPSVCCGAYIAPLRTDADAQLEPEQASLRATADESHTEQQTQVSMRGKVLLTQGNRSVSADSANLDQTTRLAQLDGNIQLREPGFLFRADKAKIHIDSGETRLENTTFVLYDTRVHGTAAYLQRSSDDVFTLDTSEISSCEPGDNAWSIQGSKIAIHQNQHYGTAQNMRIHLKDVPVFYMPYARFPVGEERLSGFLFPLVGYSGRNGLDTALPFYWNIAPNYDAIITPRYIVERGAVLELDARHMSEEFDSELLAAGIENDQGSTKGKDPEGKQIDHVGEDRWFYTFTQKGGRGQRWSSDINYTDLSDIDYFRDLENGGVGVNQQAYREQRASLAYQTDHWVLGSSVTDYRPVTYNQSVYRELPRIHVNGDYSLGDWDIQFNNEYTHFVQSRYYKQRADTIIFGERFNSDYRLVWDNASEWGFIKPSIAVKSLSYQFAQETLADSSDQSLAFVVPQASVDTGLYFERFTPVFNNNYLQTLEPRLFYFYSQYKDQSSLFDVRTGNSTTEINTGTVKFDTSELTFNYDQLFRTSRFAGGDRLDDANQVSLALSSALVSQQTGVERLRVSLGKIVYGEDRRITIFKPIEQDGPRESDTRSTSPLALKLTGQVNSHLRATSDLVYDELNGRMDYASTGLHYLDDQYRIFNLTYRYTLNPLASSLSQLVVTEEKPMNQVDVSVLWPLTSRWSLLARTNHDFAHGVELDSFLGLEYNDCCYRLRLLGRRSLEFDYNKPNFLEQVGHSDYDTGFSVEMQLKGLGSMGQTVSNLLDKVVTGFSDREKNIR
jgi:LPS-assembly protein